MLSEVVDQAQKTVDEFHPESKPKRRRRTVLTVNQKKWIREQLESNATQWHVEDLSRSFGKRFPEFPKGALTQHHIDNQRKVIRDSKQCAFNGNDDTEDIKANCLEWKTKHSKLTQTINDLCPVRNSTTTMTLNLDTKTKVHEIFLQLVEESLTIRQVLSVISNNELFETTNRLHDDYDVLISRICYYMKDEEECDWARKYVENICAMETTKGNTKKRSIYEASKLVNLNQALYDTGNALVINAMYFINILEEKEKKKTYTNQESD